MKKSVVNSFVFAAILLSGIVSHAYPKLLVSDLVPQVVSPGQFGNRTIHTAQVAISMSGKTITLTASSRLSCPPGKYCAQIAARIYTYELPIVSIAKGPCNSVIYKAEKDLRIADGSLQTITVTDSTKFSKSCFSVHAVMPVMVELETVGMSMMDGQEYDYRSSFVGDKLELIQPAVDPQF